MKEKISKNDFSKGSVWKHILSIAIPMTVAQLIQVMYNVIDRVYIGHMDTSSAMALTGLGLTFPVITLISAFTALFGMGGAPLCSIARGKRDEEKAEKIMGNTLTMLIFCSIVVMIFAYISLKPILYLFGASDVTYPYARDYLLIYLIGTPFIMIGIGMNGFINAQGFAKIGMFTVTIGAVVNLILDPIFIFAFNLGIKGAAIATVIAQFVSAVWVMKFLFGPKTLLHIRKKNLKIDRKLVFKIMALGLSGFIMSATTGFVQVACNATLKQVGGDLYVGIMTIINSVRDLFSIAIVGLTSGAQPVIGFNYGAKEYDRVKKGIKFITIAALCYTLLSWLIVIIAPKAFIGIFNSQDEVLKIGVHTLKIYFMGFFMMAFQFAGQSTFVALGMSKHAVFFSLLRKVVIVIPLTLLLPYYTSLGIDGVFWAEPVSNFIGGAACYITMMVATRKKLKTQNQVVGI